MRLFSHASKLTELVTLFVGGGAAYAVLHHLITVGL